MTGAPRNSDNDIFWSGVAGNVKSGACAPGGSGEA
jgi:hypothetical protein